MKAESCSALLVPPEELPDGLPRSLNDVEPLLIPTKQSEFDRPITLFLTVDVEDSYFDRPILMAGEGIGREFGVFGILDELESRALRGTFFVNVYERDRQPEGVVEEIVREIAARGHEVGLHTHPSPALDFYQRPLFRLELASQVEVIRWGADLIAEWTGEFPTSFRAGAYALNDETFSALERVGIPIDSSCFFPSPHNHNTRHTVNAIARSGAMIEVPVTTVLRATQNQELAHRKLDLDWLTVDELTAALTSLAQHGADYAMFMMHSFSFIEKETRMLDMTPSSRARFVSEPYMDRYVEVYGSKPAMREAFAIFLDHLIAEPLLKVRTLRQVLPDFTEVEWDQCPDVVPVVFD